MDAAALKSQNLMLVSAQLEKLLKQLAEMDKLVAKVAVQAQATRKLGIHHGSLFMAVNLITEQGIVEEAEKEKESV